MICPYCDSRVRDVPDNRCCPNCGGPLGSCVSDEPAEASAFPEPPLGVYSGNDCWLEIGKSSVRIRKEKVAFTKYTDYEIDYREMTGVVYQPAEGESLGYLCLRCRLNQNTPFLAGWTDGLSDPTTVLFKKSANAAFAKVYAFLQQCVDVKINGTQQDAQEMIARLPMPPIGVYKGKFGTLEITENAVCFVKKYPLNPQTQYVIHYKDLVAVTVESTDWWKSGCLRVRCRQNSRMGFTKDAAAGETEIHFSDNQQDQFWRVYEFLNHCARIANEARCAQEEDE